MYFICLFLAVVFGADDQTQKEEENKKGQTWKKGEEVNTLGPCMTMTL